MNLLHRIFLLYPPQMKELYSSIVAETDSFIKNWSPMDNPGDTDDLRLGDDGDGFDDRDGVDDVNN